MCAIEGRLGRLVAQRERAALRRFHWPTRAIGWRDLVDRRSPGTRLPHRTHLISFHFHFEDPAVWEAHSKTHAGTVSRPRDGVANTRGVRAAAAMRGTSGPSLEERGHPLGPLPAMAVLAGQSQYPRRVIVVGRCLMRSGLPQQHLAGRAEREHGRDDGPRTGHGGALSGWRQFEPIKRSIGQPAPPVWLAEQRPCRGSSVDCDQQIRAARQGIERRPSCG